MDTVGMPPEEQQAHLRALAAILHLGNVRLLAREGGGSCEVEDAPHLASAARLLGVDRDALAYALGHKSLDAAGQRIYSPLTAAQATASRDALAKALYQRCFNALVHRVNASLVHEEASSAIGILDMYGFENVDGNGFEQLFINYANERLQLLFNDSLFKRELEEYTAEGVPVPRLQLPDNTVSRRAQASRRIVGCCSLHARTRAVSTSLTGALTECSGSSTKSASYPLAATR